ncbi:MAG: ferrous iron transport protein B [Bacteroidia bacterium]|nr:MAG: ferrous iron transport protein B [Bacteroidia bacterium]
MSVVKKFLLVGSPNSGKTTLFNALTGLHQHTANYSGVTTEKYIGYFHHQNIKIEVIDLPGIYSLYPTSLDEQLAVDEIVNTSYDGIILVVNADQLQKNLMLVLQTLDLKKPTLLVLNMMDEAEKKNIHIDVAKLSELLDVPVVSTNARKQKGIEQLKSQLFNLKISNALFTNSNHSPSDNDKNDYIQRIKNYLHVAPSSSPKDVSEIEKDLQHKNSIARYIAGKTISTHSFINTYKQKIDDYLTHKVYGFIFLFITLLIVFQLVFVIAEYPMEWIEWSMSNFSQWLNEKLPENEVSHLIVNGIVPGITGVIMFVPQIGLLFLMIGILEESGYMARISFLLDNIFGKFGLSGKSLIPLVSGVACAVPSVLATRTLNNPKEKLITVLVLPFMSCSARLPVYTLMISLIFPDNQYFGFLNIKGLMLLGLYALGLVMALSYAWIFHKIIRHHKNSFFFIELPPYKIPFWKNLIINVWNKVKIFITDAGKIIMAISVILWFLSTHTFPSVQEKLNQKYTGTNLNDSLKKEYQKELLENSYIGKAGKLIEPVIRPLGYDWKIGIALITSFAAREVFVGTMATLYSAGTDENIVSLREKINQAENPQTHQKVFTTATNVSLLIYYALAMQCISTMVIVYRELQSFKWMLVQFVVMTGTAYLLSFAVYQLLC